MADGETTMAVEVELAIDQFVGGVITAAALNADAGEPGGTARSVPVALVPYEERITSRLRKSGVGFAMFNWHGNLSVDVRNDRRALEFFKRRSHAATQGITGGTPVPRQGPEGRCGSPADSRGHTRMGAPR